MDSCNPTQLHLAEPQLPSRLINGTHGPLLSIRNIINLHGRVYSTQFFGFVEVFFHKNVDTVQRIAEKSTPSAGKKACHAGEKRKPSGKGPGASEIMALSVEDHVVGMQWKNSNIGIFPLLEIFAGSCEMGGKFLGFCWP